MSLHADTAFQNNLHHLTPLPRPLRRKLYFVARRKLLVLAQSTSQALTSADLKQLESALKSGAEETAVTLATSLRDTGTLKAFGTTQQVPKRKYTLEELRLNKIEPKNFLSPNDTSLNSIRTILQASYFAGLTAAYLTHLSSMVDTIQYVIITAFLLTADQIANSGGLEALIVDTAGRFINPTYARRVVRFFEIDAEIFIFNF